MRPAHPAHRPPHTRACIRAPQAACDACHVTLNKNAVVGDVSAMNPGGVRIGSPAMTSRGLREADFEGVADFLHEVVQVREGGVVVGVWRGAVAGFYA